VEDNEDYENVKNEEDEEEEDEVEVEAEGVGQQPQGAAQAPPTHH